MSGDTRAAEYVLGLLDAKAREEVARDPALKDELAFWEAKLAPAATGVATDMAPAAATFDRIMARIDALGATAVPALPGTVTLRANEGAWEALPDAGDGVERKMLWDDAATGRHAYLIRLAAGGHIHWHAHPADEECYVISGDLNFGPLELKAGDFHLAKRGVAHPPATSKTGAVFLISTQAH
jgi:quercetin dioxygenase-like cupin family protein